MDIHKALNSLRADFESKADMAHIHSVGAEKKSDRKEQKIKRDSFIYCQNQVVAVLNQLESEGMDAWNDVHPV